MALRAGSGWPVKMTQLLKRLLCTLEDLSSSERPDVAGSVITDPVFAITALGLGTQADPWRSLDSQPSLLGELQ